MAESANAPHAPVDVVHGAPLARQEETRLLNEGRAFAWRLWLDRCRSHLGARWDALSFEADGVEMQADPERLGDAILARKEFPASYHLASVHDDALQGVTLVVRGEDLREAAHLHVLLQALFDWPTPLYRHHRLIAGADGKRLAKRDHAQTLRGLRDQGATALEVRALLDLPT